MAGPTAGRARPGCRRSGWRRCGPGCGGTPRRGAGARRRPGRSRTRPPCRRRPPTRTASWRARSLPLSSIAASTPPPDQARTRAPAPLGRVGPDHVRSPHRARGVEPGLDESTATTSAPARTASRVASSPITPCPKTATRSPSLTSAASSALRAIDPDPGERARHRVLPRPSALGDGGGGQHGLAAVTPDAVHQVADGGAGHVRPRPRRPHRPPSSPTPRRGRQRSGARRRTAGTRRPRSA